MSLISLPAELQLRVCRYLSCSDLAHMVLCSKSLQFASRALYENVSIQLHGPLTANANQILRLANLLSEADSLASLVKTVQLSHPHTSNATNYTSIQHSDSCFVEMRIDCRCPLTASRKHKPYCNSRLRQPEKLTFVPQQLLDACPNIRKLEFTGFIPSNWAHSVGYSKMQNLGEIAITDAEELSQVMLQQIAALPRFHSFSLSFDGFRPAATPWTPPVFKMLTRMKVVTTVKLLNRLQTLLLVAPNLTSLDLELDLGMVNDMLYFAAPDFAEARPLPVLGRALRGQLESHKSPFPAPAGSASPLFNLEHLRLAVSFSPSDLCSDVAVLQQYGDGPVALDDRCDRLREVLLEHNFHVFECSLPGSIGPLSDLVKLQTLEISPAVLFGRKGGGTLSSLPTSLRELRVRDDPITWETFEGFDPNLGLHWWKAYYRVPWIPSELDAGLKEYAEDKEQHLPHLEKIIALSRLVGDPQVELSNKPDADVVRMLADLGTKYEIHPMV